MVYYHHMKLIIYYYIVGMELYLIFLHKNTKYDRNLIKILYLTLKIILFTRDHLRIFKNKSKIY